MSAPTALTVPTLDSIQDRIRNRIRDSFVELMHPGCRLPWEITALTGITDAMLKGKPPPEEVMPSFHKFLGDRVCVAPFPLAHGLSYRWPRDTA